MAVRMLHFGDREPGSRGTFTVGRRYRAVQSRQWQGTPTLWDTLWSLRRLPVTANVVPSSSILVTLMMEALSSFETSVLTRATRRNIPEEAILHSHCSENLKSYIFQNLSTVTPSRDDMKQRHLWQMQRYKYLYVSSDLFVQFSLTNNIRLLQRESISIHILRYVTRM
jgi:hypothetical protein